VSRVKSVSRRPAPRLGRSRTCETAFGLANNTLCLSTVFVVDGQPVACTLMPQPGPSSSLVDKCGKRVRTWFADADASFDKELATAATTIFDYRAQFQYPLVKLTVGLRRFVIRECPSAPSPSIPVAQRLKRFPRILEEALAASEHATDSDAGHRGVSGGPSWWHCDVMKGAGCRA
jgi:hypothetical protein